VGRDIANKKRWQEENRERINEYARAWRRRNPEASSAASDRWRAKNPGKVAEASRKRYAADPDKSKAITQQWRKKNLGRSNYISSKRRAAIKNATPRWLTAEQEKEMQALYDRAAREGKQVDHMIPITHKRVCGLHVPWNLQVLTKSENCRKRNKLLDYGCAFV
jgi:hypothetical protein